MHHKLTEENFRLWLDSKADEEVIGIKRRYRRCPIARFMEEVAGYKHKSVYVDGFYWGIYLGSRNLGILMEELPVWAEKLVKYIDTCRKYKVTAKKLKRYYANS